MTGLSPSAGSLFQVTSTAPLTEAAATLLIDGRGAVVSTMSKNCLSAAPTTLPLSTTIQRRVVSWRICRDSEIPGTKVRLCSVGAEPSDV